MTFAHHRNTLADKGTPAGLTTERVWRELTTASFAIVSHVTPTGNPRSSGIMYLVVDRHLLVVISPDSWKARQITNGDQLAVTVPVRRGGLLSLVAPIPPATISFHARAETPPGGLAGHRVRIEEIGKNDPGRTARPLLRPRARTGGPVPDLRGGRVPDEDAGSRRSVRTGPVG